MKEHKEPFTLFDPTLAYVAMTSPLRLVHRSREGVSRSQLNAISKSMRRTVLELSTVLPSSYSSLTKKEIFDKATSEHILMIRELFDYGLEVFGDINKFNSWLDMPSARYDHSSSFSMLDTSFGIGMVKEDLYRIDFGLPA